jgi:hypothetical protein
MPFLTTSRRERKKPSRTVGSKAPDCIVSGDGGLHSVPAGLHSVHNDNEIIPIKKGGLHSVRMMKREVSRAIKQAHHIPKEKVRKYTHDRPQVDEQGRLQPVPSQMVNAAAAGGSG